jgi:hypothetical protein
MRWQVRDSHYRYSSGRGGVTHHHLHRPRVTTITTCMESLWSPVRRHRYNAVICSLERVNSNFSFLSNLLMHVQVLLSPMASRHGPTTRVGTPRGGRRSQPVLRHQQLDRHSALGFHTERIRPLYRHSRLQISVEDLNKLDRLSRKIHFFPSACVTYKERVLATACVRSKQGRS